MRRFPDLGPNMNPTHNPSYKDPKIGPQFTTTPSLGRTPVAPSTRPLTSAASSLKPSLQLCEPPEPYGSTLLPGFYYPARLQAPGTGDPKARLRCFKMASDSAADFCEAWGCEASGT